LGSAGKLQQPRSISQDWILLGLEDFPATKVFTLFRKTAISHLKLSEVKKRKKQRQKGGN